VTPVPHTLVQSRVPFDFAERVRLAAEAEQRSVSFFARRALEHELARVEQPAAAQS
jgi:hypothetical protein